MSHSKLNTGCRMSSTMLAMVCIILALLCTNINANEPEISRYELANKMRVSIIKVDASETLSMFTYLPVGFLSDEKGHIFWSRLVERLVTQPTGKSNGVTEASYIRLDTWVWPELWQDGIKEHTRLLRDIELSERHLAIYQEDIYATLLFAEKVTVRDYEPYIEGLKDDAALAAFAQACRHGQTDIPIERDIAKASIAEVRSYYKQRWPMLDGAHLCVIGNIDPEMIMPVIQEQLGSIPSENHTVLERKPLIRGPLRVTWDLNNQYLILAWPTFDRTIKEYAALMLARQMLFFRWCEDENLCMMYGPMKTFTGNPLPEGYMCYVIVALNPGISSDEAQQELQKYLHHLRQGGDIYHNLDKARGLFIDGIAMSKPVAKKKTLTDRYQYRVLVSDEVNCYRKWSETEHIHGEHRQELLDYIKSLTAEEIRNVVNKYLTDKDVIECAILSKASR